MEATANAAESQDLTAEAVPFEPLHDQILVEWEPDTERVLSIWLPETARRPGALGSDRFVRIGRVIKCGPGDYCRCTATSRHAQVKDGWRMPPDPNCPRCHGAGRLPMHVKPGDRIVYDHPSNRERKFNGQTYVILHEEQHVMAVIE